MGETTRSPWVWLGCGCAIIVGAGLVVIGALTFVGIRTAKTMADPVARQDKALQILSVDAIPVGYSTELAIKVPFFAELVVLEGDDRQFVYLKGLRTKADLRAAFANDDTFDTELRRAGLKLKRRQKTLARDALHIGAAEIRYILVEGEISFDAASGGRAHFDFDDESGNPEIGAVFLMRCTAEDKPGLGLWMGPRAASGNARAGDAEMQDATADQAALVDFIGQFGFCNG